MIRIRVVTLVASAGLFVFVACATATPVPAPGPAPEGRGAAWPESWGVEFGLRCAAAGEDVRFCACVAREVQRASTPDELKSLGPAGLQDAIRVCRGRIAGVGGD
jgi:hypothetical protein